ncbi:MAG: hypothetical protein H5U40_00705, partial [Polyangiaceae bacterium]|nr:hypothetical protein [Polyangiaceae bacterium]
MMSASTMLDVLSAAQAHGGTPTRWADDVAEIVLRRVSGTVAFETESYTAADRSLVFLGSAAGNGRSREITRTGHESLSADDCREIYETSNFARTSRSFFRGTPPPELLEGMTREGIGDILGVVQPQLDRRKALCFTVLLAIGVRTDARLCRSWGTLVRHLGALAEARSWLEQGDGDAALAGGLG